MTRALVAFACAVATVMLAMRGEHEPALASGLAAVGTGYVASQNQQSVVGAVLATLAALAGGGYVVLVALLVLGMYFL